MSQQKQTETRSRRLLREALDPWLVIDNHEHDYGIDAFVEVTAGGADGVTQHATGKRFAVQLKATTGDVDGATKLSVSVHHLGYWLESTEPVMIVRCHVPSKMLWFRWVDDALVEELDADRPEWLLQESVTIRFDAAAPLSATMHEDIRRVASRRSHRYALDPGTYRELHKRSAALATEVRRAAASEVFESVTARLARLDEALRDATYVIAIIGPSRAGKSTLLNALLRRDVSPVGHLPTTAVTILVTAGQKDEAEVVLQPGEVIEGAASEDFLRQYASQEDGDNPDNIRGVRHITVRLVRGMLERGISFLDAPGLRDPSEEIRRMTKTALRSSHAVLYVLDISAAEHGGFVIDQSMIEDLASLQQHADKLFLILNKADVVSDEARVRTAEYVDRTLKKYDIHARLPAAPVFMSAKRAHMQPEADSSHAPLKPLEDELWRHVLTTKSIGLARLLHGLTELDHAILDLRTLAGFARKTHAEAEEIRGRLSSCTAAEARIVGLCNTQRAADLDWLRANLAVFVENLAARLETWLRAIPLNKSLPNGEAIQNFLRGELATFGEMLGQEETRHLAGLSQRVNEEIEQALDQIRLPTRMRSATGALNLPSFSLPPDEQVPEMWLGMIFAGVLASPFGFPAALGAAFFGSIVGFVLGKERHRERAVRKLVERSHEQLKASVEAIQRQWCSALDAFMNRLRAQVRDRLRVFVHDARRRLDAAGRPLSVDEQSTIARLEAKTADWQKQAESLIEDVQDACLAVRPPEKPERSNGRDVPPPDSTEARGVGSSNGGAVTSESESWSR